MLTFEFDDARVLYFFSVITTVTDKPALIETDFLKKLLQLCTKDTQNQKDGVVIRGSSGTGKTFSCVYLWKKLKEQGIPFLVCSTLCLMQTNFLCFEPYIRSFLEGNCNNCICIITSIT